MTGVLNGPGEGTWSVFAMKVVEERDEALAEVERLRGERDEARAHTSTAAFMRVERQRDEARADFANACDVGRRQEARAEKAERERDEARSLVDRLLAEWQRDLDGCNTIIDRLKARLGER